MSRTEIRTTAKETVMDFRTFQNLSVERIMGFVSITGKRRAREISEHAQPQRRQYKRFRDATV